MQTTTLFLNSYDTSRLGLVVERVEGWAGAALVAPVSRPIATRAGKMLTSGYPTASERTIEVYGKLGGSTAAIMRANLDELKARAGAGMVEVGFIDRPDRIYLATLLECQATGLAPQFLTPYVDIALRMAALDPYAYTLNPTIVAFGVSPALGSCPLGTVPVRPVLVLTGAATNPVVTYRDSRGVAVGSIGLTLTLAATDFVTIDCDLMTIRKTVSGTTSDALSTLSSGDFLVLDPDDGTPTLEVSAGAGEAFYRKAWR